MALSELLAATLERAHDPKRATDNGEFSPQHAAPVLSAGTLIELEDRLEHGFPLLLRCLYAEIGNGGFGPGYGLVSAEKVVERALAWSEPGVPDLLPFVYWGCTVYSVTTVPTGRVGIVDLDAVDIDGSPLEATFWQYDTLDAFWNAWLSGEELFFPLEDE
ncbi:hypothetical protein [Deinococcus sp.]|uniref:hypothetical protein n=1 Tax=Deinococcus sp. TaxID=47478 RepID=UPI0025F46E63|nr:hypothetical protein [Deinococcus sp.]